MYPGTPAPLPTSTSFVRCYWFQKMLEWIMLNTLNSRIRSIENAEISLLRYLKITRWGKKYLQSTTTSENKNVGVKFTANYPHYMTVVWVHVFYKIYTDLNVNWIWKIKFLNYNNLMIFWGLKQGSKSSPFMEYYLKENFWTVWDIKFSVQHSISDTGRLQNTLLNQILCMKLWDMLQCL